MKFNTADLDALAKLMKARDIIEMDLFDTESGEHIRLKRAGNVVTQHPRNAEPPQHEASAEEIQPLDKTCECGHMMEIEHSPDGCLLGCDVRICAKTK